MKTLIVEDDFTSRLLLQELLRSYGPCEVAVNGKLAVAAVASALKAKEPFELICLDIMMPEMDGQQALKEIRALENDHGRPSGRGARVLMTTALHDKQNIMQSFREQCDGYLVKPIDKAKLLDHLRELGLAGGAAGNG
jgi:two-component system chemotaxis response regulator CheY